MFQRVQVELHPIVPPVGHLEKKYMLPASVTAVPASPLPPPPDCLAEHSNSLTSKSVTTRSLVSILPLRLESSQTVPDVMDIGSWTATEATDCFGS